MLIFKSTWWILAVIWLLFTVFVAGAMVPAKAQTQAILTIVLRDSHGTPLEGVTTEVLSYDWGLELGMAYSVIAKGETDKNGVVAFDSTPWPFSGYRVKFTPTDHTKPTSAWFLPDSDNQYRGYPGISTGGVTETQKFVLSGSDGLIYNDLSNDGELPQYQRDPVGGLENPRVSVMPGQNFLASVAAATATAEARGEPTPTLPPPAAASPRPGQVQSALTVTPGATQNQARAVNTATTAAQTTVAQTTSQTTSVVAGAAATTPPVTNSSTSTSASVTTAAGQTVAPSSPVTRTITNSSGNNLVVSILLAVLGLACLALFWKFRFKIYQLIGIEIVPGKKQKQSANPPKSQTTGESSKKGKHQ